MPLHCQTLVLVLVFFLVGRVGRYIIYIYIHISYLESHVVVLFGRDDVYGYKWAGFRWRDSSWGTSPIQDASHIWVFVG